MTGNLRRSFPKLGRREKIKSNQKYLKFPKYIPSPFRWGRVRVGVDKEICYEFSPPSPQSPPTLGRGGFLCKMLEINSQI
jgi:hypothetical protein